MCRSIRDFPSERIRFILGDANIKTIVSMSAFADTLDAFDVRTVLLDGAKHKIDAQPGTRLADSEVAAPADQLCYIIYTSGTTGNPKGVAIEHPSICNFVRVAAELYGYQRRRPRLSGHDHRLRLLGRGNLGAADGGRDARSRPPGRQPRRRGARRFPARPPRHGHGLLPDLARDHRTGSAAPAHPAGRRRSLPAKSRRRAGIARAAPSSIPTARPKPPSPRP